MSDEPITTTTPSGGSVTVPAGGGEDWEKRYKGQVAAYTRLETKFKKLEEDYEKALGDLEELRSKQKSVDGEKKVMTDQIAALEKERNDLNQQVQSHTSAVERTRLIMAEFTDLAQFEARGLLPSASTVDEMRQKFTDFRTALGSTVASGVQNAFAGQAPAGAGGAGAPKPARTKEMVYDELVALAGRQDRASREKYDQVMKEWLELN